MTPTEIGALAVAASTVLGSIGMFIQGRRSGRLSADEHQRNYIQDQQEDINDLRRDLALLWAWAMKTIRRAAAEGLELDPLPSELPHSKKPSTEKGA